VIIGVDFDGVVVRAGEPLTLRGEADKALRSLARHHDLILHSVRCQAAITDFIAAGMLTLNDVAERFVPDVKDAPARFAEMKRLLQSKKLWTKDEGGVFTAVWMLPGKPYCDVYLDDRCVNVKALGALAQFASTYA